MLKINQFNLLFLMTFASNKITRFLDLMSKFTDSSSSTLALINDRAVDNFAASLSIALFCASVGIGL